MKRRGQKLFSRLCTLLAVCLLATALVLTGFAAENDAAFEPVCYEHGDVNADGVIDSRDAIYTLYHAVYNDSVYPVSQDCDFDGDGDVDGQDAIYVLYASLDIVEGYELKGTVHQYYDPEWTWSDDYQSVQVTFKCGCGETHTMDVQTGVTVTESTTDATCLTVGEVKFEAKVTFEGKEYSAAKSVTIPVISHEWDQERTCSEGSTCKNCGLTLPALGHAWALDEENSSAATCEKEAVLAYKCSHCDETKTVTLTGLAVHSYAYVEDTQISDCEYAKLYRCSVCGDEFTGPSYYKHTYTSSLTKEATCSAEGEKTYTCSVCGDSYTEAVAKNDSHAWDEGVADDSGVTTFTCTDCGTTKTAVNAEDKAVSNETLKNVGELLLSNDTSVSLDEDTIAGLDEEKNVQITVEPVDVNDTGLAEELWEQIGEVFNFSMTYEDGEEVTAFGGEVTISLPYELQEGDDVDCIDVWYINDAGEWEVMSGTYSNGYVTFTTSHFSYYTVTRLTPAQRCEKYGHYMTTDHQDPTCTKSGHHVESCKRCGYVEKDEVLPQLEHNYEESGTAATCTEAGTSVKICTLCKQQVTGEIPALGHEWVLDEAQSEEATCEAAGKNVYKCAHEGCTETYTEDVAQIEHEYELSEEKEADCANKGYKKEKCKHCGKEYTAEETAPKGHEYLEKDAEWTWNDDHSVAEIKLHCAHDGEHCKDIKATVTKEVKGCDGTIVYTATTCYNGKTYTSTQTVETGVVTHKAGKEWKTNATQHYHECELCKAEVDAADHNWGTQTVTKAATCVADGSAKVKCTVCGYEKTVTVPATGKHDYVDGKCTVCGKEEDKCIHGKVTEKELDLSAYGVCEDTQIWEYSCECGENQYIGWSLMCDMEEGESREETLPDGRTYTVYVRTCKDCGLVYENAYFQRVDEDICRVYYVYASKFIMDGETIAEREYIEGYNDHGGIFNERYIDLADYGMCGDVLYARDCFCGERTYTYRTESVCQWEYSEELSVDDVYVCICSVCGATRTEKNEYGYLIDDPCQWKESTNVSYAVNGQSVYTYTNTWSWTEHWYEVTDYEMLGESCEDGVYITEACSKCGVSYEYYAEYHTNVKYTETDLSGYGFCVDSFYQYECACGENGYCSVSGTDDYCSWSSWTYDEEADIYTRSCSKCGLTITRWTEYGPKDENCEYKRTYHYTYSDSNGKVAATGWEVSWYTEHEYQKEYVLLGESCEDGVEIKYVCANCGNSYSSTIHYHETYAIESYNLADYGLCAGTVEIRGCACGENCWSNWDGGCEWNHVEGATNEDGSAYNIYECSVCGATHREDYVFEQITACKRAQDTTITFSRDGKELLKLHYVYYSNDHKTVYDLSLAEGSTSCEDGYYVTKRCLNCDYTCDLGRYSGDHGTWIVGRETITDDSICGSLTVNTYRCACGLNERHDSWTDCQSESGWTDEDGYTYWACDECGLTRKIKSETVETDVPCVFCQTESVVWYTAEGKELTSYVSKSTYTSHSYTYTFELLGETCDDGYNVTRTCQRCGHSYTDGVYYGCENYKISEEIIHDGSVLCGKLVTYTYSCACGAEGYTTTEWEDGWCRFSGYYDDEEECWRYTCRTCGNIRKDYEEVTETDVLCEYFHNAHYVYETPEGEEIVSYDYSYTETSHIWLTEFELLGETCDDGYNTTHTCQRCGHSYTDGVYYGCSNWLVGYEELVSSDDACGTISLRTYACACGSEGYMSVYEDCDWESFYDEDADQWYYVCEDCGLTRRTDWDNIYNHDNCTCTETFNYTYSRDGEVLASGSNSQIFKDHEQTVASYERLGESCEDGYYVTWTCVYCGEVTDGPYYEDEHYNYSTEYYDLSDLGVCGGNVDVSSCACGERANYGYWFPCNYYYTGKTDPETGASERYCPDCGTFFYVISESEFDRENCLYKGSFLVKLVRDGEVILNVEGPRCWSEHSMVVKSFEMDGLTCEEGYTINYVCAYCDYTSQSWSSGHNTYTVERVNLDSIEGLCGGEIYYKKCPCGENERVDWNVECESVHYNSYTEENADGYTHYFQVRTCNECGLNWVTEYYDVPDAGSSCYYTRRYTYCFYNGEELIVSYNTQTSYDDHDYQCVSSVLQPGSVDCTDGVDLVFTCADCGHSYESTGSSHFNYRVGSIDLQPYGAVCETELVEYACACGYEHRYDLSTGGNACDMDGKWTSNWIDGVIDEGQETIEGWIGTYSDSYILTCAVTDPQCAFKIRMSEYWLAENCVATEYQTWQLGYDEETDTWLEEITIATGEQHTYHQYKEEQISETLEDGTNVNGWIYTCTQCQSYYCDKYYYQNGSHIKSESEYVNTLDNAEMKRRFHTWEYGYQYMGYNLHTLTRDEYTYADGSEYWAQDKYTYDFTEGCWCTCEYTNSNGDYSIYRQTAHNTDWSSETTKQNTCTQYGEYVERWTCVFCGVVTEEYTYKITPSAHNWHRDWEKGCYYCYDCGLENINGASGSIVMEDMTEAYGSGTDYVVGYWNRDNVEAIKYVSVVLNDVGEDVDNELILDDITFTELTAEEDGITAITFNQADVLAAAEAAVAEAGYEGTWAIRFTFVPKNSEDTLDYAITFDSLTA